MYDLRPADSDVVAILCADLHVSLKPPVARSVEIDWLSAMSRSFYQLGKLESKYDAPVVIAGDICDRADNPAELVNWLFGALPRRVFAIPGQHDMKYHSYKDLDKTTYWTLVTSGRITNLYPSTPTYTPRKDLVMYGFPWGFPPKPLDITTQYDGSVPALAVVHAYCWAKGRSHPGARSEDYYEEHLRKLSGYTAAVFGDNHQGFRVKRKNVTTEDKCPLHLFNAGTFLRRRMDERDYQPCVGLLHQDGTITRERLDVSEDKFLDTEDLVKDRVDVEGFIDELTRTADAAIDFHQELLHFMTVNEVNGDVRRIVLKALENSK